MEKLSRMLKYYYNLINYAATTDSNLFHILWFNRFDTFDRTLLNLYYRLTGKKLVFTAHNVNAGERDGTDSFLNRFTLKFMYNLMDHIFVHTELSKAQLIEKFSVSQEKVTVIPMGINDTIPQTDLTRSQARARLDLGSDRKVLLFFGRITSYKGLEYLVSAFKKSRREHQGLQLVIAGKVDRGCDEYWETIRSMIEECAAGDSISTKIEFIPDSELEVYFKAADAVVLPYKHIFQSGPLFLAYKFGLPVIATDVGSFKDDIVEGETGLLCKPEDPEDLSRAITEYFRSDLYKNLSTKKAQIIRHANESNSWSIAGEKIAAVYGGLSGRECAVTR